MNDSSNLLRLTEGMRLYATTSGWRYVVRAVGDKTVRCDGPHGAQTVARDELESHIKRGLVEVEEWR